MLQTFQQYGVRLAGGDTVVSPGPLMLSITLQGIVKRGDMLLRSGARVGDQLLVTGDLGSAGAGLELVKKFKKIPTPLMAPVKKLRTPVPRLKAGQVLARSHCVHAMLDLSDGLATDVRRLAKESGVGVVVWTQALPVSRTTRLAAAKLGQDPYALALRGGEDYELLFVVAPGDVEKVTRLLRTQAQIRCHVIGEVVPSEFGLSQIRLDGRRAPLPTGWEHGRN